MSGIAKEANLFSRGLLINQIDAFPYEPYKLINDDCPLLDRWEIRAILNKVSCQIVKIHTLKMMKVLYLLFVKVKLLLMIYVEKS